MIFTQRPAGGNPTDEPVSETQIVSRAPYVPAHVCRFGCSIRLSAYITFDLICFIIIPSSQSLFPQHTFQLPPSNSPTTKPTGRSLRRPSGRFTARPVMFRPTGRPTGRPVTAVLTKRPTARPVTARPAVQLTLEPTSALHTVSHASLFTSLIPLAFPLCTNSSRRISCAFLRQKYSSMRAPPSTLQLSPSPSSLFIIVKSPLLLPILRNTQSGIRRPMRQIGQVVLQRRRRRRGRVSPGTSPCTFAIELGPAPSKESPRRYCFGVLQ